MTRWVLLLCLGTLLSLSSVGLQEISDTEENGEDLDYMDNISDEIDDEESVLNPNTTETEISRWSGRRADVQKRGKQGIWKVIRREVRDMKNFLPNLAKNISWMELDFKDMNRHYFSLVGDIRVIKSEVMIIRKMSHTIWQNVTDTRRDHKRMNKTMWWILNNVTLVIEDVEKAGKYVMDMSTSYLTVTKRLEDVVNRMSGLSDFAQILQGMSSEFSLIKATLMSGSEQISDDVKSLSNNVVKMGLALFEVRDNVSRLFPRREEQILAEISDVSIAIASQSQFIKAISNSVGDMTTDILQASRRIDDIWMLINTLGKHIDMVGEKMLTVNYNMSRVRDGVVLVDEKVTLIGSNLVEIYRQVGDLGTNMTAFGIQFGGLSNNINDIHHGFDRVDTHLGDVHNKIILEVGSIKGDLDEMKVQLRGMRDVIAVKCESSWKSQETDCEETICPSTAGFPNGFNNHSQHSKPDFPPGQGYPPVPPYPGQPTPGYPPTSPESVHPPPEYLPSSPESVQPVPEYPPTSPPPDHARPGYPPSPPLPTHPPTGHPPYPPYPNPPTPGYPPSVPYPIPPTPGYPPTVVYPAQPVPGYPPYPMQPPPPGYPPTTQYPQTTLLVHYPSYPPTQTPGYPPTYSTTTAYPTTIVYTPPYPPTSYQPTTPSYPPVPEYPLPPSPASVPTSSETPRPSTSQPFETGIPWTSIELPSGPHGPGLPIGCGDKLTGLCACSCPCDCTCPIIERDVIPTKNSIFERFSLYRLKKCQCICSCPCEPTVSPLGATPVSPVPALPRPANPTETICNSNLLGDLIREIHGLYQEIDDVKKTVQLEHNKTRDLLLDEVDKKFDDFSREIRVVLDANFNLHMAAHNITISLHDIKDQIFEEINRVVWVIQVVGFDIIKAIFGMMYGDSGRANLDVLNTARPAMIPVGPPPDFLPSGRPPKPIMEYPLQHQRPPMHMPGIFPGRPEGRPGGRPGRPSSEQVMPSSVWGNLENPGWPPSPVGVSLLEEYPMTPRPETYFPWRDPLRRQQNGTSPTNGTTEMSQTPGLALRMLPNKTPEQTTKKLSGKRKKKKKKRKKKHKKDRVGSQSRHNSPNKIGYPGDSIDYEDYNDTERDDTGYDVGMMPDNLMDESETEVAIPDDNMDLVKEQVDPFAFHNMLQKHIKNQWIKAVRPGSVHRDKGKRTRGRRRRPFGRWRGRNRNRHKIPRPVFPIMPGFPFIQPTIGLAPPIPPIALPKPLRIRPPRIPPIPPIPSIPNIFASLPHRINGSPYSISYNDGRGTSWNVNMNRRSKDIDPPEFPEGVSKDSIEEGEHKSGKAQAPKEEHQVEEGQEFAEEHQTEDNEETKNEIGIEERHETVEDEDEEEELENEGGESNESTEDQ